MNNYFRHSNLFVQLQHFLKQCCSCQTTNFTPKELIFIKAKASLFLVFNPPQKKKKKKERKFGHLPLGGLAAIR
jgi:hypothetical protein